MRRHDGVGRHFLTTVVPLLYWAAVPLVFVFDGSISCVYSSAYLYSLYDILYIASSPSKVLSKS